MTLMKNLILVGLSSLLVIPAMADDSVEVEQVGQIAVSNPLDDFKKAVKDIFMDMDLNGAVKATAISNSAYNNTIPAVFYISEKEAQYFIPDKVALHLVGYATCDVNQNGGCVVVERDMQGMPTAYYVGVAYAALDDIQFFRKEVDTRKFAEQIQFILTFQQASTQIYSQTSTREDLIRKHDFSKWIQNPGDIDDGDDQDQDEDKNEDDSSEADQDRAEKAQIREAILNDELISEELLMKHLPVKTEISEVEAAEVEAELGDILERKGKRTFQEVRNSDVGNRGTVTCYPYGWMDVQRPKVVILGNVLAIKDAILGRERQPDLKGKAKLVCYKDGKVTHRINMEAKRFFNGGLGLGFGGGEGRHYMAGLLTLGVAESPIALLTCKKENGMIQTFREYVKIISLDASFGVGPGVSAIGLSSCKSQRPMVNLLSGSGSVDTIGAGVGLFDKQRIGLDPDDF